MRTYWIVRCAGQQHSIHLTRAAAREEARKVHGTVVRSLRGE